MEYETISFEIHCAWQGGSPFDSIIFRPQLIIHHSLVRFPYIFKLRPFPFLQI